MENIQTMIDRIRQDPSVMKWENEGASLMNQLLEIGEDDLRDEKCVQAVALIDQIFAANHGDRSIPETMILRLYSIGWNAYSIRAYRVAERVFQTLANAGNISARNNYAYMIRRGEISDPTERDAYLALDWLLDGFKQDDAFSLVNTALVFALMFGDDESWHRADSIFETFSRLEAVRVSSWWKQLAEKGELEGCLVLFFLLRYQTLPDHFCESIRSLAFRLTKGLKGFPAWLAEEYAVKTMEDVLTCEKDPTFDQILKDYLETMPETRENVLALLEAIDDRDLQPVYQKLMTDCFALLTPGEWTRLRIWYRMKFSGPLPGQDE